MGSGSGITLSTTAGNVQTITWPGIANFASLGTNFGVRIVYTKSGTTSSTANVDAVGISVNYTNIPATAAGAGALTATAQVIINGTATLAGAGVLTATLDTGLAPGQRVMIGSGKTSRSVPYNPASYR
jgi:hypothetical protein